MKTRPDFYGVEFDWFATDPDGFVAVLSSAGYGPIPDAVFERLDRQEGIEKHLTSMCGYSMTQDWDRAILSFSKSGIFFYDWKHWDGPYVRLGFPEIPQRVEELFPPELRDGLVAIPEHFSRSRKLRPELLLPCTMRKQTADHTP